MTPPPTLRSAIATVSFVLITACGGGGSDPSVDNANAGPAAPDAAASTPVAAPAGPFTYGGEVLAGRLVVTSSFGDFTAYALATGQGTKAGQEDDVWWEKGQSTDTLVRWDRNLTGDGPVRVSFFDTTTWQQNRPDLIVRPQFRYPKLSADGKYVLALWRDDTLSAEQFNNPMTIIETATGRIVKRDWSLIDDDLTSIIGSPVDWLPDNSYVFLDGRRLYRSTLDATTPTLIATLDLADNLSTGGAGSLFVHLRASPDGRRIAFTWNGHLWVANVDGTDLHRITELGAGSTNQVLGPSFGSLSWSPDGQWVSGVLFRTGSTVSPVFPDTGDTVAPAYQVIGSTGCASPVFVLRADTRAAEISWPTWPAAHGVRVRGANGQVLGLTTCSTEVHWIP